MVAEELNITTRARLVSATPPAPMVVKVRQPQLESRFGRLCTATVDALHRAWQDWVIGLGDGAGFPRCSPAVPAPTLGAVLNHRYQVKGEPDGCRGTTNQAYVSAD